MFPTTGCLDYISNLDTSRTVSFSTVMMGPASRTDGRASFHLYGVDIDSGEVDEYTFYNCHYKQGARTLLSSRVLLEYGFSSPDLINLTYTHIESGRRYRLLDSKVDYLFDQPADAFPSHVDMSAAVLRTGDSSDWMWAHSQYTA